jgi:hypothetical protein
MRPVRLQTLINNVDEANRNRWESAHNTWITKLGFWTYRLALRGNLYTKNPRGEMVQICVNRNKAKEGAVKDE